MLSEKKTISEDVRKTIAKSRLYEWSMTRSFGRDAVVFSRCYLYNCKTRMVKNSVYLFRIHFAGKFRIGARLLPPSRQMLFLFRFYFILSHSLASSSLLSFSLSLSLSLAVLARRISVFYPSRRLLLHADNTSGVLLYFH